VPHIEAGARGCNPDAQSRITVNGRLRAFSDDVIGLC